MLSGYRRSISYIVHTYRLTGLDERRWGKVDPILDGFFVVIDAKFLGWMQAEC